MHIFIEVQYVCQGHIQICADGGANRLRQVRNVPEFIPKIICGDLDSCDKENIEYYKQKVMKLRKTYKNFVVINKLMCRVLKLLKLSMMKLQILQNLLIC